MEQLIKRVSCRISVELFQINPAQLISDVLPFGRLWYGEPNAIMNAIGYAKHRSRLHHAVIRVYDAAVQCDRNARTGGTVQRVVSSLSIAPGVCSSKSPVSTCNAVWRTPGPSSLPPVAHRLLMWAPRSPRYRAVSPPLGLRPLPEARHGRRSRQ